MDPEVEAYLATWNDPARNPRPPTGHYPAPATIPLDYLEIGDIIGVTSWPNYIRCKLQNDSFNYPSRAYWATFAYMNGTNLDAFCTYTKIVNENFNGGRETELREVYRWLGENPIQAAKYYAYDIIREGVYYFNGERKHAEGFQRQFPKSECEIYYDNIYNSDVAVDLEADPYYFEREIYNHFFSHRHGQLRYADTPTHPLTRGEF